MVATAVNICYEVSRMIIIIMIIIIIIITIPLILLITVKALVTRRNNDSGTSHRLDRAKNSYGGSFNSSQVEGE